MTNETTDNLIKMAKNKFLLSNAVALRAKQISEGSLPYINDFDPTNSITTAIREISRGKIKITVGTGTKENKKPVEINFAEELKTESPLERLAKGKKPPAKKVDSKKKK